MYDEFADSIVAFVLSFFGTFLAFLLFSKRKEITDIFLGKKKDSQEASVPKQNLNSKAERSNKSKIRLEDLANSAGIPNGDIFAASIVHVGYANARNAIINQIANIPLSKKFMIVGCWVACSEAAERLGNIQLNSGFKESWSRDSVEDIFGDITAAVVDMGHNERISCAQEFEKYGLIYLQQYVLDIDSAISRNLQDETDVMLLESAPEINDKLKWN